MGTLTSLGTGSTGGTGSGSTGGGAGSTSISTGSSEGSGSLAGTEVSGMGFIPSVHSWPFCCEEILNGHVVHLKSEPHQAMSDCETSFGTG